MCSKFASIQYMLAVGGGEKMWCAFKHAPATSPSSGPRHDPSAVHLETLNSSDLGRLIYSPLACLSPPDSAATRQNLPAVKADCSRLSIIPSVESLFCSLTNKKYTQKPTTSHPCRHTHWDLLAGFNIAVNLSRKNTPNQANLFLNQEFR